MSSTFSGIEIGRTALQAHNIGMQTIGHNISNASTEGYSRQRVNLSAAPAIYTPGNGRAQTAGQIGQGVSVTGIERAHNQLIEERIVANGEGSGYWEVRDQYILMAEQVYNEPNDSSVRTLMDQFWEGWQELSFYPDQMSAREQVVSRGQTLIDGIHNQNRGLSEIQAMVDDDVKTTVGQVNNLLDEISTLNNQITRIKAEGDSPNDLLDQRDLYVRDLSKIIDITVDDRDPDEYSIHTGGLHLVQGNVATKLELSPNPDNNGYSDVVWEDSGQSFIPKGGRLGALIEVRDVDLREEIQKLDMMTLNFTDGVNEIHREGYGLNNQTGNDFFVDRPVIGNLAGNYDRNGDGEYDSSYIFRMTGSNVLETGQQVGLAGELTLSAANGENTIPYYPADTVGDIVSRINNSQSEVVAVMNRNGQLSLKGTPSANSNNPDFVIRTVNDSGQFLAGYAGILADGSEGYNWAQENAVFDLRGGTDYAVAPLNHPSAWLDINSKLVEDTASVAAGLGENGRAAESGDGHAALAIAALREKPIMIGSLTSFDDYFADTLANIGLKGAVAEQNLETQELVMKDLMDWRDSVSGVNVDEELSQMIMFQHGYSAAARFITTIDEMLNTVINGMGA